MSNQPYNSADFCHRGKQWGLCTTLGAHFVLAAVVFTGLPAFNAMVLPAPAAMEQKVVSLRVLPAPQKSLAVPPKAEAIPTPPVPAPEATPVSAVQRRIGKQPSPPQQARAKASQSVPKTAPPVPAASTPSTSSTNEAQSAAQNVRYNAAQARQTTLSYFLALLERNKHYPRAARKLGLEGLINVELRVDAQGNIAVLHIGATTAHPVLRKAMDESLHKIRSQWQAQHARQGGHGGEALSLTVPVRFSLQDGA